MPNKPTHRVTQLLADFEKGDKHAEKELLSEVYGELHKIANAYMRKEKQNHTLQPTALLNEAFIKLIGGEEIGFQNRTHFFAVSAKVMRQILLDHAKAKKAEKRGGGQLRVTLNEAEIAAQGQEPDLLALDECLEKLAALDPRQAQVVELRYFGGLSIEETANVLQTSPATVKRDWNTAKLWLYRELKAIQES